MIAAGNSLDDFPAESFTIVAFCEACGHRSSLDRAMVPDGKTVQELPRMLRCHACGERDASIRIIYTGAGGFAYGGKRMPG